MEIEIVMLLSVAGLLVSVIFTNYRIDEVVKQLERHWDYMKSLDRQAANELELHKLHLGLHGEENDDN